MFPGARARVAAMALMCAAITQPAAAASPAAEAEALSDHARALELARPAEALADLDAALARLGDDDGPRKLGLLVRKGECLLRLGRLVGANAVAERAVDAARAVDDPALRLDAETLRLAVWTAQRKADQALPQAEAALARAKALGLSPQIARLANVLGGVQILRGHTSEAIDLFLQALRIAEAIGDARIQLVAISDLATLDLVVQDYAKVLELSAAGLATARRLGDPESEAALLLNRATALEATGHADEELPLLLEARRVARESGLGRVEVGAIANLADVYLGRGEFGRAAATARDGIALSEALRDETRLPTLRVTYAQALSRTGRVNEAIPIMKASLEAFQRAGMKVETVAVLEILADTCEGAGRYRDALAYHRAFKAASDELLRKDKQEAVARFQAQYEAEKRDRELEALRADNKLKTARLERRRKERVAYGVAVLSAGGLAATLFVRGRAVRRANDRLAEANARLEELSLSDPLTGLRNRRYFNTRIDEDVADALRRAQEGSTERLGLVLVDLDHFKRVNDTYGHLTGDLVLRAVAQRLQAQLRASDMLVRWGGEELLVVSRVHTPEGLAELARRLVEAVAREPVVAEGREIPITLSAGSCAFPFLDAHPQRMSVEQTLDVADGALYLAKRQGRNRAIGARAGAATLDPAELELVLEDFAAAVQRGLVTLA